MGIGRRTFLAGSAASLGAPRLVHAAPSAPEGGIVEVGPTRAVRSIGQALRTPGARTVLIDPGRYREAVELRSAVILQAADWKPGSKPSVVIEAGDAADGGRNALRLFEDKAAVLCRADVVLRGLEIVGAHGHDATNAAGVRNEPGRNVTLEDCDVHHNQANLLVTGGEIVVRRTALHHNTSDGQSHNLYYASYRTVAPGTLLVEDSRIYHSANGNNLKSNARATTVRKSYIGTIPVPVGTSPGGSWLEPKPGSGQEWLFKHAHCVSNGSTCDGKELDISYGGALLVEDCHILKASSASGFFIGYGFEGAHPGQHDVLIQRCTFYKERDPCFLGNRVRGARMRIKDSRFVGTYDHQPTKLDTNDPRTNQPLPGTSIELVNCKGR